MDKSNLEKFFENAYAQNSDGLFRFALYKVSDRDQAIDIVEDTFLRFWETLKKESVAEPRALLYRIARNLIIDWYKKKKSIQIQTFPEGDNTEQEIYMDMFKGNILSADIKLEAKMTIEKISELEPIYKEAIYLRYVEELSPKEIAEILGESANVISVRINRGLRLLKSKLHI